MDKETLLSIGRPQRECMNCHEPFENIERHPSVLRRESDAYRRFDYCPECWEQLKQEAFESFWIARRSRGRQRVPKLSRRERSVALHALFETLWEKRTEEDLDAQLFVLSHLLMKWGGLRWKENRLDAARKPLVVFEDPGSGDWLEIAEVDIEDERLVSIQRQIEDYLGQFATQGEEVTL